MGKFRQKKWLIRKVRIRGCIVCCVGGRGATVHCSAARHIEAVVNLNTAVRASAFDFASSWNDLHGGKTCSDKANQDRRLGL